MDKSKGIHNGWLGQAAHCRSPNCNERPAGEEVSLHALWNRRHATKFNGASYPIQCGAAAVFTEEGKAQVSALIEHYMGNAALLRKACQSVCFPRPWARSKSSSSERP